MSKHTEHIAFFIRQKLQLPALYVRAAALLLLALLLLRHRTAAAAGVVSGIHTCLGTLIPSLFPFILLACLCTNSRAAQVLFRPLSPVMRHVFRLPACAAPAVLLGLTAGYPTGAKITANLYAAGKLTREQAARLLCFCTAPGYAFAAAYTGSLLLRSDRIGLNLFFACALAPLLLGLTLSRFAEKPEKSLKSPESAPGGIVSAVQDGIKATVSLCGFVLVFSMLLAVLHDAGIFQYLCGFLSRLGLTVPLSGTLLTMGLEITAGVTQCVYWHLPVYFLAFGLGFSGVCIHLQIFSFFHKAGLPLSKTRYVLARFLNGLLSAAFYLLLSYFLPANTSVAVETSPLNTAPMAGSAASSLALIVLSMFFLLTCILRSGKTPSKICGGNSTGKMLQ